MLVTPSNSVILLITQLTWRQCRAVAEGLRVANVGRVDAGDEEVDQSDGSISRHYQSRSTLITTNRPFAEWHQVFPNAACVVSLIDRLVHNADIIAIEGESYRLKEARERTEQRARQRRGGKS
jgi:IstB-like ATP binding protein